MSYRWLIMLTAATLAACTGDNGADDPGGATATAPAAGQGAAAPSVTPTGRVIEVFMYTNEKGNYFEPKDIEAHRGDVIRFTLKSGVHNVHFLPDSNPGKQGLPAASEFLQLPDQTWDFVVGLAPGHYYFQCDPHALLGMIGRLEVEDEK